MTHPTYPLPQHTCLSILQGSTNSISDGFKKVFCLNKLFPPKSSFLLSNAQVGAPWRLSSTGRGAPTGRRLAQARRSLLASLHTQPPTEDPSCDCRASLGRAPQREPLTTHGGKICDYLVIQLLFENTSVTVVCSRIWRTWELGLTQIWISVDILSLAWFIKLQQNHDGDIS